MAARVDRHWLLSGMVGAQARRLIRSRRLDLLVETSGFTRDTAIDIPAAVRGDHGGPVRRSAGATGRQASPAGGGTSQCAV